MPLHAIRSLLSATVMALVLVAADAGEVPYGHPDFFPSHDRPLGFLADGHGHYPGATPPDLEALGEQLVVWKRAMPAPGMAGPLVVGEKVFVLGDPWRIWCLNVHDGSPIWERSLPPWLDMPPPVAAGCEADHAYWEQVQLIYADWRHLARDLPRRAEELGIDAKAHPWMLDARQAKGADPFEPYGQGDEAFRRDVALVRRGQQAPYGFNLHTGGNSPMLGSAARGWRGWTGRVRDMYNLCTWSTWYGWLTWAYMTPVTDGTHIYVTAVCNHVACLDLDGRLVWMRWLPNDIGGGAIQTRYVKSPLLAGDALVWRGDSNLVVLDKRTGAQRWRYQEGAGGSRPHPESGPLGIMTLPVPGGQDSMRVVLDPAGKIFRLDDGKQLGELPGGSLYRKQYLPFGDVLVGRVTSKKQQYVYGARLVAGTDRDTVRVEELWRMDNGNWSGLRYGLLAYIGVDKKGAGLVDPLTGQLAETPEMRLLYPYGWNCIAGDTVLRFSEDRGRKYGDSYRKQRHLGFQFLDLKTGRCTSSPMLRDEPYGDDAWRRRWIHRGTANFLCNGTITAQANRVFLRSIGTTWCLGDRSQPFPVNPAWPPTARIGGSEPHVAAPTVALDGVVGALTEGSHDHRQAALASLATATTVPATITEALIAAHAAAAGARRNDLARALGTIGAAAGKAAAALADDVLAADRGTAISAGWALSRMGPDVAAAVAPVLAWLEEAAAVNRNKTKTEMPHKRMMAAALALAGTLGVERVRAIKGWRPFAIEHGLMIHAGALVTPEDRPIDVTVALVPGK